MSIFSLSIYCVSKKPGECMSELKINFKNTCEGIFEIFLNQRFSKYFTNNSL